MPLSLLGATLLGAVEQSLNRLLAEDPVTLQRLSELEGRVIAVHVQAPDFSLYLLPHAQGIDLMQHYDGEPDTCLEGSALLLSRLPLAGNEVLFGKGVRISGDSALAHRLQAILADTRIEWEAWLGNLLGDAAGHEAARLIRSVAGYGRDTLTSLLHSSSEYLQEEARLLPTQVEVDYFLDQVDELRDAVERLDARIARLDGVIATPGNDA